jgi:hypothetical protein
MNRRTFVASCMCLLPSGFGYAARRSRREGCRMAPGSSELDEARGRLRASSGLGGASISTSTRS